METGAQRERRQRENGKDLASILKEIADEWDTETAWLCGRFAMGYTPYHTHEWVNNGDREASWYDGKIVRTGRFDLTSPRQLPEVSRTVIDLSSTGRRAGHQQAHDARCTSYSDKQGVTHKQPRRPA